jgi:coenzyme F420-reducing hydrogenase delta subunit/ferredoxin
MPGVFAAGDVLTGPATVIEAIAAGHRAAESIRHYVEEGRPDIREERPERRAAVEYSLDDVPPIKAMRVRPAMELPEPGREFAEVEQAFDPEDAVAEARRCLRCGPCGDCHICAPTCQRRHIMVRLRSTNGASGAGTREPTALVRTPGHVARALDVDRPTSAWLLPGITPETLPEIDTSKAAAVELRPVRAHILEERCRGCGRCIEVCHFGAPKLSDRPGPDLKAHIEATLCRGCNLCTAVCPTKATVPSALSPEWWGSRLEDIFSFSTAAGRDEPSTQPVVVLACQRRAGAMEAAMDRHGVHVEVIRFRCVGQVDAGMLVELYRQGARGILVAGCLADRCRFEGGAEMAMEQVNRARAILSLLGGDPGRIACDWSGGRAKDPLDVPVKRLVENGGADVGAGRARTAREKS